jgi:hypothetical protein
MRCAGKEMKHGCADRAFSARNGYQDDETKRQNNPHKDSRYIFFSYMTAFKL